MLASEKIKKCQKELQEMKKKMSAAYKEAFYDGVKEIFTLFPIESFSWVQYTPWFNDGDECVFNVYLDDDFLEINGHGCYNISRHCEHDGKIMEKTWSNKFNLLPPEAIVEAKENFGEDYVKWINDATDTISGFISSIDEEELKNMFGNHVRVTVKKDGTITQSEYEHD